MIKVGFIGAGNMGSALIKAAKKINDVEIYVYDKDEAKAKGLADGIGAYYGSCDKIASE